MSISGLNPFRLTKLYSDTKASADNVVNTETSKAGDDPDLQALHRRLRIQKERLVTWGLEWSDESKSLAGAGIDESFARTGLSENVGNILRTIAECLDEATRLDEGSSMKTAKHSEVSKMVGTWPTTAEPRKELSPADRKRYEELCKDLTTSIDILYDLSRARKAFQQGTYPQSVPSLNPTNAITPEKTTLPPPLSKAVWSTRSFSSSGETLVTPTRTSTEKTIAVADLPPRIDSTNLVLPQEPPPPYGSTWNHSTRMIGHLKRSMPTSSYFTSAGRRQDMEPVMVEYSAFDSAYRETGVGIPSTEKLDQLLSYFAKCNGLPDPSVSGTLNCLGYFDDLAHSRYGLVYELPRAVRTNISDNSRPRDLRPTSLLGLLQATSKTASISSGGKPAVTSIPPLEERFRMAHNIVRSFSRLHEDSIIHRDVSSNNVILFTRGPKTPSSEQEPSMAEKYDLQDPYICAFDLFSEYGIGSDASGTLRRGVNIYQHPDAAPHSKQYKQEFDMYSLGLILLEIGMWLPLSDLFKQKYSLKDFKNRVENVWVRKLAGKVGSVYMHVVKDCLSAATTKIYGLSNKAMLSQIYAGMLGRLKRCCLLDENEPIDTPISDSMQNSTALENMVKQGIGMPVDERISQWTGETPLFAEPGVTVESVNVPTFNLGLVSEPLVSKFDGTPASRQSSMAVSEHQYPHQLPVAIAEDDESALSRRGSRTSMSPRHSFGFGSPRLRDDADNVSIESRSSKYTAAAVRTIQRAWRTRRETLSFKEYKRKVTVIQQAWRKSRNSTRNSASGSSPSETGQSSYYTSTDVLATRVYEQNMRGETTIRITPHTPQPPKRKLRIQPVKLSAAQLEEWHSQLLPRLEKIVSRALRNSPESVTMDLLCVGETPAKAKPTMFITCSSISRVKSALSKRFVYNTATYDLKVRRGKLCRSKSARSNTIRRAPAAHRSMANDNIPLPLNPFHQVRPLCGASIGAYANGKHLPPVSYGGVVMLDGEPYGMTVHHLLDEPSDDESEDDDGADGESGFFEEDQASPGATRSSANGNSWLMGMNTAPGLELDDEDMHNLALEISDESSVPSDGEDDISLSSDDDISLDGTDGYSHASTEGDLTGIDPKNPVHIKNPIFVTQPAIDDVDDDFFPQEEDRDEDHLASHRLGTVHASSGIRRWNRNGVLHEIDWALLKIEPPRLQPVNLVQGGRRYLRKTQCGSPMLNGGSQTSHKPDDSGFGSGTDSPNPLLEASAANRLTLRPKLLDPVNRSPSFSAADDEYPTRVAPCDGLSSLRVHCFGRTSGLKEGIIGAAMSSVRIYRRRSFSRSWHVLGEFGMGGDSGAWVIENDGGRVVGHVLAWCEKNGVSYFCPMEVLMEDVVRVLGADRIGLPGGGDCVVGDGLERRRTDDMGQEKQMLAGAERYRQDDDDLQFAVNGLEELELNEKPGGVILGIDPVGVQPARHDTPMADRGGHRGSKTKRDSVSMGVENGREKVYRSSNGRVLGLAQGADITGSPRRIDASVKVDRAQLFA